MKNESFKKQIQNIEFNKLFELLGNILSRENYEIIEKKDGFILTNLNIGLQPTREAFILNTKPLSGNDVDLSTLEALIANILERNIDSISIISTTTISNSIEAKLKGSSKVSLKFIPRDALQKLIEKHYPNYLLYESFDLIEYERFFLEEMTEKSALLNIKGLETRVKKLLSIYIKPQLYELKKDLESDSVKLIRVNSNELVNRKGSAIIEGDTGSGKSTLLKELGRQIIKKQDKRKSLPIYLSPFIIRKFSFNILNACESLLTCKIAGTWKEILTSYNLVLLIDGIDEFDKQDQESIVNQLHNLSQNKKVRYVLTTRSIESNNLNAISNHTELFRIRKFNDKQIREFANRFFDDENLSKNLIEALTDNRILERIPLSPLSMSLISLVYEKENFEIPATISDIYDNFNQLILGKATANNRFELIKFNFRERILSVYALKLLQAKHHQPLTKTEFIDFFLEYFKSKSSPIEDEVLIDFLNYFISNSGILVCENDSFIKFSHKSFLQYYASLEIFKHQRNLESSLVDNFYELDWQNVSVFYGGQSKDMPDFLKQIINKIKRAETIEEYTNSIMGIGYLLQALYQTNNNIREEAVHTVLNHHLILHDWYKKISTDNQIPFFRNMRLPSVSIFNMYFFYLNFLSHTLTQPLGMAFERLLGEYKKSNDSSIGYKLLTLAAIFHSTRIHNSSYLNRLIDETDILNDPYLTTIAEFALYFDSSKYHQELKRKIHKAFSSKEKVTDVLRTHPISKLRFSNLDVIQSNKKVVLITEGETDVEILEHAYTVLTGNKIPYWRAKPAGINSGGAQEVRLCLDKSSPTLVDGETIIGIFDADSSGINNYNGLNKAFTNWKHYKRVKKLENLNVFGVKIPFPEFRLDYSKTEIESNYLAIEHYFSDDILNEFNMLKKTSIPKIFKIKDSIGAKKRFSKHLKSLTNPNIFKEFIPLFETIDDICDINQNYYEFLS
ncbi:NACHT domain-containing protein [Seonamhaeicola sp. NFXS20]|uniref:NACHT domain-containing protein n=1 Tax=Seonamhaeicola sp. NFXS20 TaxID=2816959 RepID=UPI003B8D320C